MNIEQKLYLSQSNRCIHFFVEGHFAHVYGASLYIVCRYFGLDLKVTVLRYKKLNYQAILRAGLPTERLVDEFAGLVKTRYGYQLIGDWDLAEFEEWKGVKLEAAIAINASQNGLVSRSGDKPNSSKNKQFNH